MRLTIRNGRVIDPASGRDEVTDLYIAGRKLVGIGQAPEGFEAETDYDASGQIVCPGLIELSARLREPGAQHKATIASETRAAARGGVTTLCCPPDTDPVIDEPATVELIHQRAADAGFSEVLPIGALTRGLGGQRLAELATLKAAGCVAVSNAAEPVTDTRVLRHAFEYAATHGLSVVLQAMDPHLAQRGCAHEGPVATRLGLAGIPVAAETVALAQLLELVAHTGVRAHFGRLSAARSLELLRAARDDGLPVSADVSINHLHLTEHDLRDFDSNCHVSPPLRSERDRDALRAGLRDGLLSAVCSDHQPHEPDAKLAPFPSTEPGVSGLDTLLGLLMELVRRDVLSLRRALESVTSGPAGVLGVARGTLQEGGRADLCIFDPEAEWEVDPKQFASRGHNTPYAGWLLSGQVNATVIRGRLNRWEPRTG